MIDSGFARRAKPESEIGIATAVPVRPAQLGVGPSAPASSKTVGDASGGGACVPDSLKEAHAATISEASSVAAIAANHREAPRGRICMPPER